jgi:hypothetical protein
VSFRRVATTSRSTVPRFGERVPEAGHRDAAEVAEGASCSFVKQGDGVRTKELAVAAGALEVAGEVMRGAARGR